MKRTLIVAVCAATLIVLAGCAGTGYTPAVPYYSEPACEHPICEEPIDEPQSDTPSHTHGVLTPFPGRATFGNVSKDAMAMHPGAPRFVRFETADWLVFSFDEPVSDVAFVGVLQCCFDDETRTLLFELGGVLYGAGDLAAGQPFFVQAHAHMGTMPTQAIGFTYTDGIRYYIPIDQEQKYGNLVLWSSLAFTVGG